MEASPDAAPASGSVVRITKIEGPNEIAARAGQKVSKIPKPLQFPLVATLSLAMSALGYSLTHQWTKGVLATNARMLDTWQDVGVLSAWRM